MKIRTARSIRGPGVGGVALAGMAVLSAACATGANAPPVMGAEAEALFADLTGVWVLDESGSSPPMGQSSSQSIGSGSFTIVKGPGGTGRITGDVPVARASPAIRKATFEVLRRRPKRLVLQVDSLQLVYMTALGRNIEVSMNRGWVSQSVEGQNVRTRIF